MSIYTTADRFKELGLKPPDISFFQKPEKPGEKFGREPQYNTRVLVDNWYEDRRQYKTLCSRCTGDTIYKTDYQASCPGQTDKSFPPAVYQCKMNQDGEGANLLRNTEDYCPYLTNYTTTYDLVHNWEVRRAGVEPKPWRKWKLVHGAIWVPQNDNTVSFGNLTQIGYRKAGQVPLLPNDWDLYANTGYRSETKASYPRRKYPQDYVQCRKAPKKSAIQEVREMCMTRKPLDPSEKCGEAYLYMRGKKPPDECCKCPTDTEKHYMGPKNVQRFGECVPLGMLTQTPAKQTLYLPRQRFPYKALKHPPHNLPEPCKIIRDELKVIAPQSCKEYAGDVRFDWKGVLTDPVNGKVC